MKTCDIRVAYSLGSPEVPEGEDSAVLAAAAASAAVVGR